MPAADPGGRVASHYWSQSRWSSAESWPRLAWVRGWPGRCRFRGGGCRRGSPAASWGVGGGRDGLRGVVDAGFGSDGPSDDQVVRSRAAKGCVQRIQRPSMVCFQWASVRGFVAVVMLFSPTDTVTVQGSGAGGGGLVAAFLVRNRRTVGTGRSAALQLGASAMDTHRAWHGPNSEWSSTACGRGDLAAPVRSRCGRSERLRAGYTRSRGYW